MANSNQIPKLEHGASETALRVLWKFVKNHDSESDVGIGALLSSVLDTPEQIGDADLEEYVPAALYYTPGEELVHSWNYLPFFSRTTPERFATQNRRTLLCCYPAVWSPQGYALELTIGEIKLPKLREPSRREVYILLIKISLKARSRFVLRLPKACC